MTTPKPYKRPSLPPIADLNRLTERMRQAFDNLEARTASRRSMPRAELPLSELAPHIARVNEERARRVNSDHRMTGEMQENARAEILIALDMLRDILTAAKPGDQRAAVESANMLHAAVLEYLTAMSAAGRTQDDALKRMRDAIFSMEETRTGGGR